MDYLIVALGSAVGGAGRYAISSIPVKTVFPVFTLVVNVLGAVLIGFIVGLASAREDLSARTVLFLKTGVCGGFTTFSTFSLETYNLFSEKLYLLGSVYIAASVAGCLAGIACGMKLAAVCCRA